MHERLKTELQFWLSPNGCFPGFAQRPEPGEVYPTL